MPSEPDFFSESYEVRELKGKGKGMVAVKPIAAGELVIKETALELVQGGFETDKLKVLNHLLQNVHQRVIRDATALKAVKSLYPNEQESKDNFEKRDFNTLEGDDKFPEDVVNELNHLYNIITCNTFKVEDNTGNGEVSFALFLRTSRLNHSCAPNLHYYCTGKSINIRATKDIPKGHELTISYCNEYLTRPSRKAHLLESYQFNCTCERCQTLSETDVVLDALICPTEGCLGYITTDKAGVPRCPTCGRMEAAGWKKEIYSEIQRKPDMILSYCHPQSAASYTRYCHLVNEYFSGVSRNSGYSTPERRAAALTAVKRALACCQAAENCPCEMLLHSLRCAVLCPLKAEKEAFFKKAEQLCLRVRGDADLKKHFPSWVQNRDV
eukprot:TRINITY_DN17625_c0_g1_i1.p1 TRINITY_DN17625_c0_g1~~TRINITY_DN17625_c0_g1_i1.p1  ORF type:complete len:383 (+),score=64.66 TRINITY_DN17625_c0_g1_i1:47-1195(+)